MGVGEHFFIFHHHHHHNQNDHQNHETKNKEKEEDSKVMKTHAPPKGCMTVTVGHEDEEPARFVIPVMYINHPLFLELLKEAEDEYGFHHEGPINIPCHVQEFRNVQGIIHQDHLNNHHHHHHSHHHLLHLHHICCFKD